MTGGRVVVLGRTGRNFAAGMIGGIAYVLNMSGDFDYYCNMDMIELSLLETDEDRREVKSLIKAHHAYTGSPLAARILSEWDSYASRFIKVMPVEYKKLL